MSPTDGALSRSEAQPRNERGDGPCVPEQRELEQRELPPDACAGEAPWEDLSPLPPPRVSSGMPLLLPQQSHPHWAQFSSWDWELL